MQDETPVEETVEEVVEEVPVEDEKTEDTLTMIKDMWLDICDTCDTMRIRTRRSFTNNNVNRSLSKIKKKLAASKSEEACVLKEKIENFEKAFLNIKEVNLDAVQNDENDTKTTA